MTFKVLSDDTLNILFLYNFFSAEGTMESNIFLDPLCEETYPFFKSLPDRHKQSVSRLDNLSRKDEQD